jgi:hypothetical protein
MLHSGTRDVCIVKDLQGFYSPFYSVEPQDFVKSAKGHSFYQPALRGQSFPKLSNAACHLFSINRRILQKAYRQF